MPEQDGTGSTAARASLVTERQRPEVGDLDERTPDELATLFVDDTQRVVDALRACEAQLARAIAAAAVQVRRGGRLLYAGAGTPGRLGVLDAAECGPTFAVPPGRVVAVMAGGAGAAVAAQEAAEDDGAAGERDVAALRPTADDVVVVSSASGRTPYALGAADAARAGGATVIAVVCNPNTPLAERSDHAIEIAVGPELLAGSTRLKAGTAQKVVLNAISTSAMVASGRTFGHLMVHVEARNHKLRGRARAIVMTATGTDEAAADAALLSADGSAAVAIVTLLAGVTADEARGRLDAVGGNVRAALEEPAPV